MKNNVRSLPVRPPRDYGLRDAYNRRVWRSPGAVWGREVLFFGLIFTGLGIANDHSDLVLVGWSLLFSGGALAALSSVISNFRRVQLIRSCPSADGILEGAIRVPLLHEMFRRTRERTFVVKYTYATPDGQARSGRIWICGCARDHLQSNSKEQVIYDPDALHRSLPLRLAMMVAPHR